ncbi:hypothetical protein BKA64DRAFT_714327 [Cadophora sp. MPI-SDFR-AT-0126]|nr:hypothetical protein BKA64DRAFT_714327 [Leotiomycetes sp. MPI-SDFR-AT-0126]
MLVAEFSDHLAGGHLLATIVSKIGVEERFYLPGRLLPYAGGRSAALMYFSAFIWLFAEFSLVMALTVLAYYQRRAILKSLRQLWPRFLSRTSKGGKSKGFAEYHRPIKLVPPSVQRGLKQSDLTSDSVSSIRDGCQSVEKEQEKVNAWGIIHKSDGKGYISSLLMLTLLVVNIQLYCAQWAFWAGWISLLGERAIPPHSTSTGIIWSLPGFFGPMLAFYISFWQANSLSSIGEMKIGKKIEFGGNELTINQFETRMTALILASNSLELRGAPEQANPLSILDQPHSISDKIKNAIQKCTTKPIIWWPLAAPRDPLDSGQRPSGVPSWSSSASTIALPTTTNLKSPKQPHLSALFDGILQRHSTASPKPIACR